MTDFKKEAVGILASSGASMSFNDFKKLTDIIEYALIKADAEGYKRGRESIVKEINAISRKKYSIPGKGCTCSAWGSCECGCGASWTEPDQYRMEEIRQIKA